MKGRSLVVLAALVLGMLCAGRPAPAQEKFKLKPGAKGKACLTCHVTFQEKLKSPFVHTPVKGGECSGCHNPHASSHGKLLEAEPARICSRCHTVVPKKAASVHSIVRDGNCTACHDPHASAAKNVLVRSGNALCFGCHGDMEKALGEAKFKHVPAAQGCVNCHTPHASEKVPSLLREAVPALCVRCHKTNAPVFARQHMGYPVAASSCTGCHNPHGSAKKGILYDNVHKPVASKMCNQCHEEAGSSKPFALKKEGSDLCKTCHSNLVNETFLRSRVHWPVVAKNGCLTCHNPHASSQTGLRRGSMKELCGSCHADTIERMGQLKSKHAPVRDENCMVCHQPHAADRTFLLSQPIIELCGTCHDWQKHVSHPMGEKVTDRRNKNLTIQCLSCHNAHGTDFKNMILKATVSEMCTQCHVEYRR